MNNLKKILSLLIIALTFLNCDKKVELTERKGEFNNIKEIEEFSKLLQLVISDYPRAEEIRKDLIGECSYDLNHYLDSQTLSKMIPFNEFELKDTFVLKSSLGVYAQNEKLMDTIIHVNITTYCNQLKSEKLNTWLINDVKYEIKHLKKIMLEVEYCPQYKYLPGSKKNYNNFRLRIKQKNNDYISLFTIKQELSNNSDSLVLQQDFPIDIMQDDLSKEVFKDFYGKECNIILKANKSYFKNSKTKIAYKELKNK